MQFDRKDNYEIWMLDQSNTYASVPDGPLDCGGTLYILKERNVKQGKMDKIVFGEELMEWIYEETGYYAVRPHYVVMNNTMTHAIISFVVSGHLLILDANTRKAVAVMKPGISLHVALPAPDDSYLLLSDTNGKKVWRVNSNFRTNTFILDEGATLDLSQYEDEGHPDNAPIATASSLNNKFAYITLRGGGFYMINQHTKPMKIVHEYNKYQVEGSGLLILQKGNRLYFNSGSGTGAQEGNNPGYKSILYTIHAYDFPPNPKVVFNLNDKNDSHGIGFVRNYLWAVDRARNLINIVQGSKLKNQVHIKSCKNLPLAMDFIAPTERLVFASLRGPVPLSGNIPDINNAVGSFPGIGVFKILGDGCSAKLVKIIRTYNIIDGIETSDPHGIITRFLNLTEDEECKKIDDCGLCK